MPTASLTVRGVPLGTVRVLQHVGDLRLTELRGGTKTLNAPLEIGKRPAMAACSSVDLPDPFGLTR